MRARFLKCVYIYKRSLKIYFLDSFKKRLKTERYICTLSIDVCIKDLPIHIERQARRGECVLLLLKVIYNHVLLLTYPNV